MAEIGCFVSLLATGKAVCETPPDEAATFRGWTIHHYGNGAPRASVRPSTDSREDEFLTAYPLRQGGDPLVKPTDALDVEPILSHCLCNKVVLLGFREVIIPEEMKGKLMARPNQSMHGTNTENPFRSWAVVLLDQAMTNFKHKRTEVMRPHPGKMKTEVFKENDKDRVFNACSDALRDMRVRAGNKKQLARSDIDLLDGLGGLVKFLESPSATRSDPSIDRIHQPPLPPQHHVEHRRSKDPSPQRCLRLPLCTESEISVLATLFLQG